LHGAADERFAIERDFAVHVAELGTAASGESD
jgi:hypothetical protein